MMELHPEIKKFWEKFGVVNCIESQTSHVTNIPYYYISKQDGSTETIAAAYGSRLVYFLGEQCFYEEAMLRIIKLRAFI